MFSRQALDIDAAAETASIADAIRRQVLATLKRRGVIVGLSGGIDSSVVAALSVKALGQDRVLGLLMPDLASADDQGFFVKQGDGAADLKPIAHLYKTQVYALAAHLGVPDEIRRRPPTTDTFPMPQTQEEFYFSLPYQTMDLCLWAHNQGVPAIEAAPVVGLTAEQVERVFKDIEQKRRGTRYLHERPLLVQAVEEVGR